MTERGSAGSADSVTDSLPLKSSVPKRLIRERRWTGHVIAERDQLMSHARRTLGLAKEEAQHWVYEQLAQRYPPLPKRDKKSAAKQTPQNTAKNGPDGETIAQTDYNETTERGETEGSAGNEDQGREEGEGDRASKLTPPDEVSTQRNRSRRPDSDEASIRGLDKIPRSWPPLPPNAGLAQEIQWVQACRIDVVQELSDGVYRVRLERADRPAPSKAALGWLETSIRAYAKYCDIAAKAAATYQSDEERTRKERIAIDRIRQLLESMKAPGRR